jgi:hypothetical protein
MRELQDIIEAALAKSRKVIIETNDDEIDDWEPEDGMFRRIDEAKPVAPQKPLKPGETRKDAEIASDPNHSAHTADPELQAAQAEANADADEVERNAPTNDKAVDAAEAMLKDKNIPVNDKTVQAAKDASDMAAAGKSTQPTGSPAEVYAKNAAMNAAKAAMQKK